MIYIFRKFNIPLALYLLPLKQCFSTESASFIQSIGGPKSIKCILTDVDGTILTSQHELTDRTLNAISNVMDQGYHFFPCTGRSRKSMTSAVGDRFIKLFGTKEKDIIGVFQQGLTVYGPNNTIIFERFLDNDVIQKSVQFCTTHNIAVVAYSGDDIYVTKCSHYTNKLTEYSEPLPTEFLQGIENLLTAGIKVNKLILLDDETRLVEIRPVLFEFLGETASLTKAVPGMLEILPYGASKGGGVEKLLEHFKVHPDDVMAFGDGENDVEMFQVVKHGVAVMNAKEILKKQAVFITKSNNDHGVAHVLEALVSGLESTASSVES